MASRKRRRKATKGENGSSQCAGKRVDGAPCARKATHGRFCWWHNPDLAPKRIEATRRGWKKRHPVGAAAQEPEGHPGPSDLQVAEVARLAGRVPATVADILELVAMASRALVEGRISKTVAETVIDGAKFSARLLKDIGKGSEDAAAVAAALGISVEEAAGMTQEDLGNALAELRATALAPPQEQPS